MNIKLLPCYKCEKQPEVEIHGVSYIIICNDCNIKSKTARMYLEHEIDQICNEWNEINSLT